MAHDDIPLARANLVALWVESVLYGFFLLLFCGAMYVLLVKRRLGSVNPPMLVASIFMFFAISAHMGIDFGRAMSAFTTAPSPDKYFANLLDTTVKVKSTVYFLLVVCADAIVLYRCWAVWAGRWRYFAIFLPVLLYLGVVCAGCGAVVALFNLKPGDVVFAKHLGQWILSYFALTLTLNVLSTLLIAGRIFHITNRMRNVAVGRDPRKNLAAVMLMESAALYSGSLCVMIGVYVSESNFQYIVVDALSPIVGIAFELIIVRVGLGWSTSQLGEGGNTSRASARPFGNAPPVGRNIALDTLPSSHMKIQVEQVVDSYYPRASDHKTDNHV